MFPAWDFAMLRPSLHSLVRPLPLRLVRFRLRGESRYVPPFGFPSLRLEPVMSFWPDRPASPSHSSLPFGALTPRDLNLSALTLLAKSDRAQMRSLRWSLPTKTPDLPSLPDSTVFRLCYQIIVPGPLRPA